ncbi:unnamed protein product [Haemonchus placei]|uniref:Secreted protein n=1 Tax=Haemonchus placei TaxID=6290 RepID=A0A0N4WVU8_HAEPC|nr:unnamed protein product [Haemonchus placei]
MTFTACAPRALPAVCHIHNMFHSMKEYPCPKVLSFSYHMCGCKDDRTWFPQLIPPNTNRNSIGPECSRWRCSSSISREHRNSLEFLPLHLTLLASLLDILPEVNGGIPFSSNYQDAFRQLPGSIRPRNTTVSH